MRYTLRACNGTLGLLTQPSISENHLSVSH